MKDVDSRARPSVCAVVCTRDRTELLDRALSSLTAQSLKPDLILVVDNAPSDERTRMLVDERYPTVRYVREEVPGLNFARNRALREAGQEILAYMDDDAVADPGWIERTVDVFTESPQVEMCTGRVIPLTLETESQRLFEAQGGFDRGQCAIRMPADMRRKRMHGLPAPLIAWSIAMGVGAAMAVRRSTVEALGGFDVALDLGAALPGGGDVDLVWRLLDADLEVHYEPSAVVLHEHRRDMAGVEQQILGHRRAEIAFLTKSLRAASVGKKPVILAFLGWRLMKPGLRLLGRMFSGSEPLPASLLLRLWMETFRGLNSYRHANILAMQRQIEAGG